MAAIVIILAACHTSKKSSASTAAAAPISTGTSTTTNSFLFTKPSNGVYPPGTEELTAVQTKYSQFKDVTLETLKEGHVLYTEGACIKCHGPKNIYRHEEIEWVRIIDDMAMRAHISATEKDAVFKYVIAIKAAQSK